MSAGAIQTRPYLDTLRCTVPNCDCGGILYWHSTCHPQSPTWTKYHPDGFVEIECAECGTSLIKIAVAP